MRNKFLELKAEDIAKMCFNKFKTLPKTGKPKNDEWTVLAGVVLHNDLSATSEVVSLGCGTKCIGKSKLCSKGLILNDSHAEVLARRGLLRYFYIHIQKALENDSSSIFTWVFESKKCKLRDGISFHFLSTQTPCGDACIIDNKKDAIDGEPLIKRKKLEDDSSKSLSYVETSGDVVYTGAKLLGTQHTDLIEQITGAVRTKPGRGERTLSMSCSDKLAKWQVIGVQGALLDMLLETPIYFETLNFCQNDHGALERAIWKRFENHDYTNTKYALHKPLIRICSLGEFAHAQDEKKQPTPNGLVWCSIPEYLKPYEVSVNGKRQGVTSKKLNTAQAALAISKFHLFKKFVEIVKLKPQSFNICCDDLENKSYLELKSMSNDYQNAWSEMKCKYFKQWSAKPENLIKFQLKDVDVEENKGIAK
ncbi:tRNA-specific adenosine deaminase 1 [Stomoxys calcitrans]|uniref:tRNA-specific adenosine deaminase 1 n=1 Tax=Stomoxys calcitrans TaxID=35570 RepID=A0A1I8PCS3_STOCA|nr:tRNA-specific adenosine deaminase 1 [Stomoxys calcitrans]